MSDLAALHEAMIAALDALEAQTALDRPDEPVLAAVRYRLTRASAQRRKVVEAMCADLIARDPAVSPQLRALQARHGELLKTSAAHIGAWGLRDIQRDWQGYRRASEALRASMRRDIELEKMVLYPYLPQA